MFLKLALLHKCIIISSSQSTIALFQTETGATPQPAPADPVSDRRRPLYSEQYTVHSTLVTSNQCPGCHSYHLVGAGDTNTGAGARHQRHWGWRATGIRGAGDRVMATSLVILLYIVSSGYLVFWVGLWIVHIMAIIYGWVIPSPLLSARSLGGIMQCWVLSTVITTTRHRSQRRGAGESSRRQCRAAAGWADFALVTFYLRHFREGSGPPCALCGVTLIM